MLAGILSIFPHKGIDSPSVVTLFSFISYLQFWFSGGQICYSVKQQFDNQANLKTPNYSSCSERHLWLYCFWHYKSNSKTIMHHLHSGLPMIQQFTFSFHHRGFIAVAQGLVKSFQLSWVLIQSQFSVRPADWPWHHRLETTDYPNWLWSLHSAHGTMQPWFPLANPQVQQWQQWKWVTWHEDNRHWSGKVTFLSMFRPAEKGLLALTPPPPTVLQFSNIIGHYHCSRPCWSGSAHAHVCVYVPPCMHGEIRAPDHPVGF